MGKIVIPKHAAKESEMEAVLKIHYDAHDWVKEEHYESMLRRLSFYAVDIEKIQNKV